MIKDTGPQIVDKARNSFEVRKRRRGGTRKDPAMTHRNNIPTVKMSIIWQPLYHPH